MSVSQMGEHCVGNVVYKNHTECSETVWSVCITTVYTVTRDVCVCVWGGDQMKAHS